MCFGSNEKTMLPMTVLQLMVFLAQMGASQTKSHHPRGRVALEASMNGCLQLFPHEGSLTHQETQGHSKDAQEHFPHWVILPYYSFCSLRPVSAAVDNLVREVQSIRKRLEELNERLNVINRTVLPIRLNALQSQRRGNTQLRRLPMHRRRLYARRRPQRS